MNSIKFKTIDPVSKVDWQSFLSCGQNIRKRNSELEFIFWKDSVQNSHIIKNKTSFWTSSNGKSKGRIGVFINRENRVGSIGWYECDEDEKLNKALFNKAFEWFAKNNCSKIIGPINGSTWYQYRFNANCEKPLFPGEPFQPKYYIGFWENIGFKKSIDYYTTYRSTENAPAIDFDSASEIFMEMGLSLKSFNEIVYQNSKTRLHEFLMASFKNNPLFNRIQFKEFCSIYDALPASIPPGFSFVLFDRKNYPAGLVLAYPEPYFQYYQKAGVENKLMTTPKLIAKTIAVHPDWQNQQIGSLLVKLIHGVTKKKGFSKIVYALMFKENRSLEVSHRKFANSIREYSLFEKNI